jgi:hypothetical protein
MPNIRHTLNTLPAVNVQQSITNGIYSMKLEDAATVIIGNRTWFATVQDDWSIQVAIRYGNGVYETYSVNVPMQVMCQRKHSTVCRDIDELPIELIAALVTDKQLVDIGMTDELYNASRAA